MEKWDIVDSNRVNKGYTKLRSETLEENEFHVIVHIWVMNSKGEFLIQKRSKEKRDLPNLWAITGGSIIAGEDSLIGAIREFEEEIGILLQPNELELLFSYRSIDANHHGFTDVYLVRKDIPLDACILQIEEVDEVKYVTFKEILDGVEDQSFFDYKRRNKDYFQMIQSIGV